MIASRLLTIPAQKGETLWLPEQASTVAPEIDEAFWLVMWISIIFFAIIVAGQMWFMYAYRRRAGWVEQRTAHHNYALELSWSIIPSLLIIVLFVKGFFGFLDMRTPPQNAYDITVVAQKWSWQFVYPNGVNTNELHVPAGRPVRLVMSSQDVIHAFFVPAFRVKQDIVPGRYNYVWFNATAPGEHHLFCAEYCGKNHSEMVSKAVVHEESEFDTWLAKKKIEDLKKPPVELGAKLYKERGCAQCHLETDKRLVGPGFATTYRQPHQFEGGSSIDAGQADENFIRESIMNPQAHVREGFPPTMPTYKGMLEDLELNALVSFIRSKSPGYKLTPADTQAPKLEEPAAGQPQGAAPSPATGGQTTQPDAAP